MSSERRRYLRTQRTKNDLAQTCFGLSGEVHNRARVTVSSGSIDVNKTVFCPFCLRENKLQKFLMSSKKGISAKAECPECHNGMMLRNVNREWTPETYAEWVYNYARSGFWQKINFDEWRNRLNAKGWSQEFWLKYKALKGEEQEEGPYEEDYTDHMNRSGEEATEE